MLRLLPVLFLLLFVGGRAGAMEPAMRLLTGAQGWGPNLLRNAGFEEAEGGSAAWGPYQAGYALAAAAGRGSIRLVIGTLDADIECVSFKELPDLR